LGLSLGLRLRSCRLGTVEGEILVDHLERLWSHPGLQCRAYDLSYGAVVQLVLLLETTDRGPKGFIRLTLGLLAHHLIDQLLLLIQPGFDRICIRIGFVAIVIGRLLTPGGRWRLLELDAVLAAEETQRFFGLSLQCSLDGEGVLGLLSLLRQLLGFAGVVSLAAVPGQRLTERDLFVLPVDLDPNVAIGYVINV
jgi:hypothetical protein